MRAPRLVLFLCLGLALAACGKQADERAAADAPSATATARTAATAGSVRSGPQNAGGTAAVHPSTLARQNEDGSETVEDTTGDSGSHNPLLAAVASTVAAATPAAAAAANLGEPTMWQEGVNYTRIVPAQPTAVPAGQVEVLEFFWYACPHCYAIDPLVESWKKTKPAYITFSRVHVTWNEGHRSLARLYYTLESLGKLDQLHGEVFKEIHLNNNPLVAADPNDTAETERIQLLFVKKFGITEDTFKKAYHSFAVETALQRADQLVQRYRIDGVPTFVVNGKFVADVRSAGLPNPGPGAAERLISLVGDLAAQEHKH
jgi:thiol:disulfide interchange protein DsbA